MKFGKVLKVSSENMPVEMHDLFLRYKELKKQIKLIPVGKDTAHPDDKQASVSADGSTSGSGSAGAVTTGTVLSSEEQAFISTLNEDLARFNRFFIEKEEEAVIRIQALCDELSAAAEAAGVPLPAALTNAATSLSDHEGAAPAATTTTATVATLWHQHQPQPQRESAPRSGPPSQDDEASGSQQDPDSEQDPSEGRPTAQAHHHGSAVPHIAALQAVKSRLVQFHGEMVLLLHWSLLNYAAVVKILKKHDKRTGVLLRAPYLANVLQQPFSSTTIMSRLAKRAEELVVATTQLAPMCQQAAGERAEALHPLATAAVEAAAPDTAPAEHSAGDDGGREGAASGAGPRIGAAPPESVAPPCRAVASASEASTLTFATDKEGVYADTTGRHTAPLVGRTMHALQTWAQLRKNAITPSTVLTPEAEEQNKKPSKRKADTSAAEDDATVAAQQAKLAKSGGDKEEREQ